MQNSPVLNLPYIQPAQAQKHVTHNEALRLLDMVVQLTVTSRTLATPPASPTAGQRYIVATGANGDWAGHEGEIAVFETTSWAFVIPAVGWHGYAQDEAMQLVFDGTGWVAASTGLSELQNLALLGVGTTADAANPLSVAGDATLLTHDGDDHRLKLNKAATADTASLLFQTGFGGHAEMGLAGSDNFDIRVSPDGTTWTTAMAVDAATATPVMPQGLTVTSALTGTGVVGTVSQAAGLSTGAVMQTGETTDGRYVRYADGTQICTHTVDLTYKGGDRLTRSWNYPIAFLGAAPVCVSMSVLDEDNATPSPEDLGWMGGRLGAKAPESSVSLRLYRRAGGTDFVSGDTMTVYASAVGRWY